MWDGLLNSPHCSYIIEEGICYLALCEEAYPSQLAFSYLNNLHTEFIQQHGHEVYKAQRPYFFIEFGKHDIMIYKWMDYRYMVSSLNCQALLT